MAHRIYFSVCGEGYGHSSRDMAIAEVLTGDGADVLMGSYGYVLDRLKDGFNTLSKSRHIKKIHTLLNEQVFREKAKRYSEITVLLERG